MAADNAGLRIYDVSNPTALFEVGFWDEPSSAPHDVELVGGLAYVADSAGLRIVEVSACSKGWNTLSRSSVAIPSPVS